MIELHSERTAASSTRLASAILRVSASRGLASVRCCHARRSRIAKTLWQYVNAYQQHIQQPHVMRAHPAAARDGFLAVLGQSRRANGLGDEVFMQQSKHFAFHLVRNELCRDIARAKRAL